MHEVLVTDDGQEWRELATPINGAESVEDLGFDDGRYMAVGTANGAAIWSSLGSLWSKNDQPNMFDAGADGGPAQASNGNGVSVAIHALVQGPVGWLAGGSVSCDGCLLQPGDLQSRYAAWLSADARTWTRAPWQQGPETITSLASNETSYVASDHKSLWVSADAQAWQLASGVETGTSTITDVAGKDGEYLAVGQSGAPGQALAMWRSSNGEAWSALPSSPDLMGATAQRLRAIAGHWVIVGTANNGTSAVPAIWSSTDGERWTQQLISNDELAHAADVGAIGNTLVAIGSHGDGGPGTTGGAWVGSLPWRLP